MPPADRLTDRRCEHCGRLICRQTPGAIKPGEAIEIECWKCDRKNLLT